MSEQLVASKIYQGMPESAPMSFLSQRRFYDDANFPKGFRRSGDFTNKEAELLECHGLAMKALADGSRLPSTDEEAQFVDVVRGNKPPSSILEQIWLKYCKLAQGKPFYAVVGTVHAPAVAPEAEIELDDIDDDEVSDDEEPEDTP
ncbi:DUF413 domain-containing protein [Shewanella litorisediminis]|uniref:Macrodomain Ori protein n=1 Tax=Shewanella litorisediminis TaxID=1173586 RepID=A0ABX7FZ18_9GAMM|nr:DUF413 domain-containing protein [Shewanella litorisediminis]MCL2918744.1 DUF413 domain-containing protein [Shewanella litorisediminis]QRH00286.1 DUF413 domain-containing protein [Shewanella litorisediminis]